MTRDEEIVLANNNSLISSMYDIKKEILDIYQSKGLVAAKTLIFNHCKNADYGLLMEPILEEYLESLKQ